MKKILYYQPVSGVAPFLEFMDSLDDKARKKVKYALKSMAISPGQLSEPVVKHFCIERYSRLYELREKVRVLVRIIFTFDGGGNVILLHPFIKRHKRNTNQALEISLAMLEEIEHSPDTLLEYPLTGHSCDN